MILQEESVCDGGNEYGILRSLLVGQIFVGVASRIHAGSVKPVRRNELLSRGKKSDVLSEDTV